MKSALIDHFSLPLVYANDAGQQVTLAEVSAANMWQIEGVGAADKITQAVANLTEQDVPEANKFIQATDKRLVWQGHNRYLWITEATDLKDSDGLYITNQSQSKTQIQVSGARARSLLMRGIQVDISDSAMPVGTAVMTHINHIGVTLMRLPDNLLEAEPQPVFELWVMRGFAVSLFEFLKHTADTLEV